METAREWRYYVGAIKVIVPEGISIVVSDDRKIFGFKGYLGDFYTADIESLLRSGDLRRKSQ